MYYIRQISHPSVWFTPSTLCLTHHTIPDPSHYTIPSILYKTQPYPDHCTTQKTVPQPTLHTSLTLCYTFHTVFQRLFELYPSQHTTCNFLYLTHLTVPYLNNVPQKALNNVLYIAYCMSLMHYLIQRTVSHIALCTIPRPLCYTQITVPGQKQFTTSSTFWYTQHHTELKILCYTKSILLHPTLFSTQHTILQPTHTTPSSTLYDTHPSAPYPS